MNKDELNQDVELDEDELETKTLEDMSRDELIEAVYQLMEMKEKEIQVNTDNIQDLELDKKDFIKGLKSVSYIAGMITGLSSVGLSTDQIMDYLVNEQNIRFNKDLNAQTCQSNETVAKLQQIQAEHNQI